MYLTTLRIVTGISGLGKTFVLIMLTPSLIILLLADRIALLAGRRQQSTLRVRLPMRLAGPAA